MCGKGEALPRTTSCEAWRKRTSGVRDCGSREEV